MKPTRIVSVEKVLKTSGKRHVRACLFTCDNGKAYLARDLSKIWGYSVDTLRNRINRFGLTSELISHDGRIPFELSQQHKQAMAAGIVSKKRELRTRSGKVVAPLGTFETEQYIPTPAAGVGSYVMQEPDENGKRPKKRKERQTRDTKESDNRSLWKLTLYNEAARLKHQLPPPNFNKFPVKTGKYQPDKGKDHARSLAFRNRDTLDDERSNGRSRQLPEKRLSF